MFGADYGYYYLGLLGTAVVVTGAVLLEFTEPLVYCGR